MTKYKTRHCKIPDGLNTKLHTISQCIYSAMFTRITEKYTGIYLITIVQLFCRLFAIASLFAGCKNEPLRAAHV